MIQFKEYLQYHKKIEEIATRWVKSMGKYSGYTQATNVRISWDESFIEFRALPSCSGIGWEMRIPAKYLWDDSDLEKDSAAFYENYTKERLEESKKISELESSGVVKEYLKLKNPYGCYSSFIH